MAKDRERRLARILYVEQKKTAKQVADMVGVSEKTLSGWVVKGKWKTERDARNLSPATRIANIENIISGLADERIELGHNLTEAERVADKALAEDLRKQISKIDDAVSKWNKTLRDLNKESKIPLAVYLEVMQQIFEALQHHSPDIYMKTLEFQEQHINDISLRLGL